MFQALSAELTEYSPKWSTAYRSAGALVMHTGVRTGSKEAYVLQDNKGVILGKLFARDESPPALVETVLGRRRTQLIVESGGRQLVDDYWGSYVAILHDAQTGESRVFRGPSGSMPCYHTKVGDVDLFFSHVEDCLRWLPVSFDTNWKYLTRWLIVGRLIERECGLDHVEDMTGGECLILTRGTTKHVVLWNPVEIASQPRFEHPDEAAQVLRTTVQTTIGSWAACYDKIAHNLSGGLDSSIVAACLAEATSRPHISLLHLVVDAGINQEKLYLPGIDQRLAARIKATTGPGDERYFARLVAARINKPLFEVPRRLSMDLDRLWHAPVAVSPSGYFSAIEADDAAIQFSREHGIEAFFSGQGGDTVFFTPTQPLPAIDYAYLHGFGRDLWRHAVCTAMLSHESVWRVLWKAISHGILRRPWSSAFSVFDPPNMLTPQLVQTLSESDFTDLWSELAGASDLPPGKAYHVGAIGGTTFHDCVFHAQRYAEHVDPLNSQPIWEVMLRTPIYTVQCGGVSRGLARRAFADVLPTEIRKREAKATGSLFYQQLIRRNRNFLREHLLDGRLVKEGYLDRSKLEAVLSAEDPFITVGAMEVMSYLSAEVWLQQWAALRRKSRALAASSLAVAT